MDNNFNRVQLCGTVDSAPALSHVNHGVSFYKFTLAVERLSGLADKLTVIAAQPLLESAAIREGDTVTVRGQLRSFNNKSGQGSRLVISVFAHALEKGGDTPFNLIQLSGILCKPPVLRRTPLGREISDIILAVNRRYGRADYLPCIAWGAVAQQAAAMTTGDRLTIEGRVQSRTYTKPRAASPRSAPLTRCPSCGPPSWRSSCSDLTRPSLRRIMAEKGGGGCG